MTGPGWHRDPTARFEYRYWDGKQWTSHVARSGEVTKDPVIEAEPNDTSAGVPSTNLDEAPEPQIIMTKLANALIKDAGFHMPAVAETALSEAGGSVRGNKMVLRRFEKKWGGLWVGGRVTLTTSTLSFAPNWMNRQVHTSDLNLAVDLADVRRVEVLPSMGMKIIALTTDDSVVKVRSYGANAFRDAIAGAVEDRRTK